MKNLIATIAAFMAFQTANANYPDQMYTVLKCGPLVLRPDLGLSVDVTQGGIAGITQVRVQHFFLGHTQTETYVVRQMALENNRVGAPILYKGKGVTLSVNFTTAPTRDNGHYGVLTTSSALSGTHREELSCHMMSHLY